MGGGGACQCASSGFAAVELSMLGTAYWDDGYRGAEVRGRMKDHLVMSLSANRTGGISDQGEPTK